jgi:predicted enzyme related to lactoylglutathione lyase
MTRPSGTVVITMQLLINIDVDDLERGIEFYERGIGLSRGRRLFDGTVAEMVGGSSPVYLLLKAPGTSSGGPASQLRTFRRHWTPVHLDVVVDDIEMAIERAVALGATLEGSPRKHAWGWLATLSDPFGHGLCFVQWEGGGYDGAV